MSTRKIPRILEGKYFHIVSVDKNGKVTANCVACGPDKKPLSGSIAATSNFLLHLKRNHAELAKEYESTPLEPAQKRGRQTLLPFPVTIVSKARSKTHRAVLKFVVGTMSPLSIVENASFREMISDLNPEVAVQCVDTLRSQILEEFASMKKALTRKLEECEYVGVTCDVWSARGRSFLGVTGHWINADLSRSSVVLALKRFSGTHSFDRIALLVTSILSEFCIDRKTVAVTTDNGTNFIKAFKRFGLEEVPEEDRAAFAEEETCEEVELVSLEEINFLTPQHFRCACHTLSLIATTDLDDELTVPSETCKALRKTKKERPPPNPLSTANFKKVMRSTFAKCTGFWNAIGRSVKTSEAVGKVTGLQVVRPVATRWNSTFDAIKFLLKQKSKLGEMFSAAEKPELDSVEIQFLQEYESALEPLASALDTLQSEKDFYFGYYAPTILNLKNKMDELAEKEGTFAPVIAWTIRECLQLNKRFKNLLEFDLLTCKTEIIAACTMPWFKLRWVPTEFRDNVKQTFIECLEEFVQETSGTSKDVQSSGTNEISGNMSKWETLLGNDAETVNVASSSTEVKALQFLNSSEKDITLLESHPAVRKMFIKYNTPIPSSAPSERLFSYGGMILRPKRARLAHDIFECLATLKLNSPHYAI